MSKENPSKSSRAIKHYSLWYSNLRKMEEVLLDLQDELGQVFGATPEGEINAQKLKEWSAITNRIQHALPELDTREVVFIGLTMARGAAMQLTSDILKTLEEVPKIKIDSVDLE